MLNLRIPPGPKCTKVERSAGCALSGRVVRPLLDDHMDIDVSAARCHPHGAMGWTTFGRHAASLISPSTQVLRIDIDVREKLSRSALQCDYHQVCFWHLGERS